MHGHHPPSPFDAGAAIDLTGGGARHALQLYESAEFLHGVVARHLSAGLVAHEPVLAIVTPRSAEALRRLLSRAGHDVAGACRSGRLSLLDAEETLATFMVGGAPDRERFERVVGGAIARSSAAGGGRVVRGYGEMVDVLAGSGQPDAALALEDLWNGLAARSSFSLLCAYSMESFRDASQAVQLQRICAAHGQVVPTERYLDLGDGDARLREIALLQQRARALETELDRRGRLEAELRETVDGLRSSEEALRAADRRKDEFLAMLGHELRNPLAPILLGVQLLRLRSDGGTEEEHAVIERQVRHVARLVDDLLDVSRITRGKVQLQRAPVEISAVLAGAIDIVRPLYEERSHALYVDAPRDGLLVDADAVRLVQVMANLLTNAAKYSEPGGRVDVTAARDGGDVVVSVRDRGAGIGPEMLGRVFDLFEQGERALDRAQGGLGVGLTVARSLVELHGGRISAHSDGPGRGSTFVVRLPAISLAPPAAEPGEADGLRARAGGGALRVLVVDDNADAAEVLAEALRVQGHHVVAAHDGEAALELAAGLRPDAAVLDIGLPGMDGYELARRLRALLHPARVRLVALSGYGQDADRRASQGAGFDRHLVKPADLDALVDALAQPGSSGPPAA
jgi:signal transduction histidine kinase